MSVKVYVFVPKEWSWKIRSLIAEEAVGVIGNYRACNFSVLGNAEWVSPNDGTLVQREEERIEFLCPREKVQSLISKIKAIHPYEEPGIDIMPMLNASL